ncbi:MAG: FtsH protease activity modulator HflK, partial [Lachnospiraceae bacterium]|nr:FtsH protease activity modulator HflK [Lachnospiraceae bacterium]
MFNTGQNNNKNLDKSGSAKNVVTVMKLILAVIVITILVSSSYYTIQEEEQAVVCTFGSPKAVTTPGLHFKIPFVQTVSKVNTTIKGFTIGYDAENENMTMD